MLSALTDLLGAMLPAARRRRARPARRSRPVDPEQLAMDFAVSAPSAEPDARTSVPRGEAPSPRAAAALLYARLGALGLRGITHLVVTRNRTVLVSWRGTQLRVHRGFVDAPDDALEAIVRFVTARRRTERAEAVRQLRAYQLRDAGPRRPRRLVTASDDRAMAERLGAMHRALNLRCFEGTLAEIEVVVSRRMQTRLGHYALAQAGRPGQIALSRRHLLRHGWTQGAETLLHEMVHQWQDETGLPVDHGAAFRQKARALGITPAAKRTV